MDKLRQKYLQKWLRAQQQPVKKLMRTNIALATLSSLILVAQTYFLATLLDKLIMQHVDRAELVPYFIALIITFALRAIILWLREKIGFKPAGSWASIMLEQVENLHNFYARFLPQQSLSAIVPMVILIAVFPLNWAAGLILMITAPLVPIFMILVGIAAADSSQKNMATLSRLSAQFLDRLRGLETLRLFNRTSEQTQHIESTTEDFRETTMAVLKMAFLSSAVFPLL